jgi:antirestriction protein
MTSTHADERRIYAACLASYNSGILYGKWIDVDGKDAEALHIEIDDMLAGSPEPNVMRRKCASCGHWQTRSDYSETPATCYHCGELHTGEFAPSAEEWAIHDHEGFAGLISSEWPDLGEVAAMAEVLARDGDDTRRGLLWLVNDVGYSISDALEKCGDVYTYQADVFDLVADYARELAGEFIEGFEEKSAQWPFNCINWRDAGRELVIGGDIAEVRQDGEYFIVTNASEF